MNRKYIGDVCFQLYRLAGRHKLPTQGNLAKTRTLCHLSVAAKPKADTSKTKSKSNKKQVKKRQADPVLKLTHEQSQVILQELNTRTLEQLTNTKNIGKNKAEALIQYRDEKGPLVNLVELHNIKGYGKAFFTWLEDNGELPPSTKKFSRQHEILSLVISDDEKQKISNIVSIDIGLQNAAWVHMDREHQVLAWRQTSICKPKPYNPASLKPQVQAFVDTLPPTDAYIVEMQSHRVGKHAVALLPFVIHLRIMEAMLHCLLKSLVIPLDPHYTSKYFKLPTGHSQKKKAAVSLVQSLFLERKEVAFEVECENFLKEKSGLEGSELLVEELVTSPDMSGTDAQAPSPTNTTSSSLMPDFNLQISENLIEYFQNCKKKDDLSDCLLQALAFYNLLSDSQE